MIVPQQAAAWWAFAARALLGAGRDALLEAAASLPCAPGLPEPAAIRAALEGDPVAIEREYVRLFLHPDGAPCPPWQSVWDPEPRLMGEAHSRALEWYRRAGVEPQALNEPADHAGLLAAFWAGWILEDAEPAERAAFFRDHLRWIRRLADAIAEHARHPFFELLAALLRALLAEAAPQMGERPVPPAPQLC